MPHTTPIFSVSIDFILSVMGINSPLLCDVEGIQTIAQLSTICHAIGISLTMQSVCVCVSMHV